MDALSRRRGPIVLCIAATTWACGAEAAKVPAADTAVAEVVLPDIPASRVDVPLRYDITKVLGVVERVVPLRFGSLDSVRQVGDDPNRHYAFEAERGPFTVVADDSVFHLRATLTYKARGFFKPRIGPTISVGCGKSDSLPRVVVELAAPLTLTRDWHLASHTTLIKVDRPTTTDRDRCLVGFMHRDVTEHIIEAASRAITSKIPDIDRRIGEVDLTSRATGWWGLLSRPIRLADGVWLTLGPQRLRLGTVSGEGHQLLVHVGLDARPHIVAGLQPPAVSTTPLPRLARDTVAGGFHILIEGIVDYAAASNALSKALQGKVVSDQGHSVTIDSLVVSPARGGRLALVVGFHGDAHGTLRFLGAPRHDPVRHVIAVPDLDYDLQTDNPLVNAYSWVRSDALRKLFREKAVVPDGPAVARGRAMLLAGLNRKIGDAMTLSARVDSVAVRGLYVKPEGLVIRAEATGRATASVKER